MSFKCTAYWLITADALLEEKLQEGGFTPELFPVFTEAQVIKVTYHQRSIRWHGFGIAKAAIIFLSDFWDYDGEIADMFAFLLQQADTRLAVFNMFWSAKQVGYKEIEYFEDHESADILEKMIPTGDKDLDNWIISLIEKRNS